MKFWLKLASYFLEGINALIVLDDYVAAKDVKGRTGEPVKFGLWVLTQQLSSITKPFRENVAAIVLFYTPSAKTTKTISEEFASDLSHDDLKYLIASLKECKFSHLVFSLN